MTVRITNRTVARAIDTEQIQIRANDEGKRFIEGYAIVFNQKSKLIREWGEVFYEVIEPGAADNVLQDAGLNVLGTVDHDRAKMLGRTKSGTLVLTKDTHGLKYSIEVPNTTLGNDTAEMIARGDYFESSFIFSIAEKGYRYDRSEDIPVRYISDFSRLLDISVVIDGAYANTAVKLRALEDETNNEQPVTSNEQRATGNQHDILRKEIEILKLS